MFVHEVYIKDSYLQTSVPKFEKTFNTTGLKGMVCVTRSSKREHQDGYQQQHAPQDQSQVNPLSSQDKKQDQSQANPLSSQDKKQKQSQAKSVIFFMAKTILSWVFTIIVQMMCQYISENRELEELREENKTLRLQLSAARDDTAISWTFLHGAGVAGYMDFPEALKNLPTLDGLITIIRGFL